MSQQRHRERSEPSESSNTVYVSYNGALNTLSHISYTKSEAMDDSIDEDFHARRLRGEVFNNPCSYTVEVYSEASDFGELPSFIWHYHNTPAQWTKLLSGNLTARQLAARPIYLQASNTLDEPSFDTEAQAKSFALARVDSTPYEFFEDLMEIREVLKFLRDPLYAIDNLALVYKRRREKLHHLHHGTVEEAKALADLWNASRFAFLPLVRSCMNALEAYNNRDKLTRPKRRSSHGYSNTEVHDDGVHWWNRQPNAQQTRYWKVQQKTKESHAAIFYEVSNPLVDWRFALGLRAKDLPKTIWELFPLSFMVDRLWNLKNAIQGLTNFADPSVTLLASSLTNRCTHEHTVSCDYIYWSTGHYIFSLSRPDKVKWTKFSYEREIWEPALKDVIPPITWRGLTSDVVKITDLIALTLSRLL